MIDGKTAGEAIVGALVIVKQVADVFSARRSRSAQATAFDDFRRTLEGRLADFDRRIDRLFAFVIGPDGENGLRGDTRQLRDRVDGLEERERDRATKPATMAYDRRRAAP